MDNLQVFPLWPEENRAKKIYQGNGIFMPCVAPKEMNAKTLMSFSYDLTRSKARAQK
jgi:hypothetical protein